MHVGGVLPGHSGPVGERVENPGRRGGKLWLQDSGLVCDQRNSGSAPKCSMVIAHDVSRNAVEPWQDLGVERWSALPVFPGNYEHFGDDTVDIRRRTSTHGVSSDVAVVATEGSPETLVVANSGAGHCFLMSASVDIVTWFVSRKKHSQEVAGILTETLATPQHYYVRIF